MAWTVSFWCLITVIIWGEPMISHRRIDNICIGAMAAAVLTVLAFLAGFHGLDAGEETWTAEYEFRLFDQSFVHHIDIRMEDWEGFLETAEEEEYESCTVTVDGEEFRQVGIRAKGNNSLRLTTEYGLDRYSLKLEFDHFLEGGNYYGLDKLSLDASFQDNSYMKTFLAYDMMEFMGVPAPLCSYVRVTVNGEEWGLFLAVEEPEEAFVRRCFGENGGMLYKPDYRSLNAENADVALRYTGDSYDLYDNIFRNAKFSVPDEAKDRLIGALRILDSGENLEEAVNVDEVLRYFTVQVFVMNWDSYLGRTGHNYFLYEEDGILSILPWDYNLAFGTYMLGASESIDDPEILINYPIDTPAPGEVMTRRPLYHNLMKEDEYFARYHEYFEEFLTGYFDSGYFEAKLAQTAAMIRPYVQADATAFCSYEDHALAVETLRQVCLLRAESAGKQLAGEIPSTIAGQQKYPEARVEVEGIHLEDLGDFEDLERKNPE